MTKDPAKHDELPLHRFLTYRLARVQARLNAQATRILRDKAGLSLPQWRILALIGSHEPASSAKLANIFAFDKALFSRKLKDLVADGLVVSETDENDHRVHHLKLSCRGRVLYESTLPHMRARQRALLGSLSNGEVEAFFSALEKLENAAGLTEFDT